MDHGFENYATHNGQEIQGGEHPQALANQFDFTSSKPEPKPADLNDLLGGVDLTQSAPVEAPKTGGFDFDFGGTTQPN